MEKTHESIIVGIQQLSKPHISVTAQLFRLKNEGLNRSSSSALLSHIKGPEVFIQHVNPETRKPHAPDVEGRE